MNDPILQYYSQCAARGTLSALVDEATKFITRYIVPMYADNGYTWQPAGSAVLATYGGREFFLTARHCIECIRDGETELILAVDKEPIRMPSIEYAWPQDRMCLLDACAVRLPAGDQRDAITSQRSFLDLSRPVLDVREGADENTLDGYLVVGFPEALNKTDNEERVRPGPVAIMTSARSARSTPTELRLDVETRENLPHLDGVSGSGVWSMQYSRRESDVCYHLDRLELVAIEHAHLRESNEIVATPLAPILHAICRLNVKTT